MQEEVMEFDEALDEYRNGDADKRLSLFLTYRDLRDEFSRIDREKAVDESPIILSPTSIHGDMIHTIVTYLSRGFTRAKSCCFGSAGAGQTR
jgi:hypothetical protein